MKEIHLKKDFEFYVKDRCLIAISYLRERERVCVCVCVCVCERGERKRTIIIGEYSSDNDGQFMERVQEAECEVCEDKHPANVRCLECEENMCEKLGLAHKKSKIGKDHTMTTPKFEPQPIEPHRKTSAEENLERAAAEKISAFKTMMDAKVKFLRLGKLAVPAGERPRAGVRTWGKPTLVKCELCEDQHPATFLCVDCSQSMCDKLTAVHAKSKIGRDHELKPL